MKRLLMRTLAGVALLAAATSASNAADLPYSGSYGGGYGNAPAFTWTGFYVGANAGYGWNTGTSRAVDPAFGKIGSGRSGGFVGGIQGGYNYQFGTFVAGLETDLQYAAVGNKGEFFGPTYWGGDSDGNFGAIRLRAGVTPGNALVYGTAGFAYGDIGGNNLYDPGVGVRRDDGVNGGLDPWRRSRVRVRPEHHREGRGIVRKPRHELEL